eukprot:TRINITY_DN67468_c8_g9_i1.p1 TRINITY_DN67468_c8_g9~~TRINITY_DN67468_c8_g9_i1.p1  ORF type:complete len:324 (+),score=90.98 TRINITY_DN67468_c8_g9_i1:21-992(+)
MLKLALFLLVGVALAQEEAAKMCGGEVTYWIPYSKNCMGKPRDVAKIPPFPAGKCYQGAKASMDCMTIEVWHTKNCTGTSLITVKANTCTAFPPGRPTASIKYTPKGQVPPPPPPPPPPKMQNCTGYIVGWKSSGSCQGKISKKVEVKGLPPGKCIRGERASHNCQAISAWTNKQCHGRPIITVHAQQCTGYPRMNATSSYKYFPTSTPPPPPSVKCQGRVYIWTDSPNCNGKVDNVANFTGFPPGKCYKQEIFSGDCQSVSAYATKNCTGTPVLSLHANQCVGYPKGAPKSSFKYVLTPMLEEESLLDHQPFANAVHSHVQW